MVLGISYDAPAANKAFRAKHGFPYDLLSDEAQSVSASYGATNPDRPVARRVSVLIGPDGKVAASYDSVTPAEHADQVLADLDGLG